MNIKHDIDNAGAGKLFNSIDSKQHMKELTSREYDFLYRELKYKASFHYVDKNQEYNLVMRINNEKQIEEVVRNKKIISITRNGEGPVMEMNIEGLAKPFSFMFDIGNKEDLHKLKVLTKQREALMHFVLFNGEKLTKIFSALLNIDNKIFERLSYIVDLTYSGSYPYMEYIDAPSKDSKCIEVIYGEALLDEIVTIIDNLQKWGSGDCFSILIEYRDTCKIVFEGNITNYNYIRNELQKKFEVLDEPESDVQGIPFIKYDRGLIYFYKTRFSDNIE